MLHEKLGTSYMTLDILRLLCQSAGTRPVPVNTEECKEVLSQLHIAIPDFIHCVMTGRLPGPFFRDRVAFRAYVLEHGKTFPLKAARTALF